MSELEKIISKIEQPFVAFNVSDGQVDMMPSKEYFKPAIKRVFDDLLSEVEGHVFDDEGLAVIYELRQKVAEL